ncbi:hypothetical protein N7453_007207 [Penicillium expansum]|nr:hypothetical protein N7453_007207 [Penicillium expansum]
MPWNESEFYELDGMAPHISIPVPAKRPTANHQSPIYGNANLNNQGAANRGSIDLDISPTQRSQARKNYPLDQCKVANSDTKNPIWKCGWQGCDYKGTFGRKHELMRHIDTKHVNPRSHHCPVPGCPGTFNRKDNLDEHFQRVHG